MPAAPERRGRARWIATVLTALLALVWIANLPFYAGAALGPDHSWRMEHGRLTIEHELDTAPQSLWVAYNSEGLRWMPEWRTLGTEGWSVTIPLWIPLTALALWCARSWSRRARTPARRVQTSI